MATVVSGPRSATETKASLKTTEFWVYLLLLVALFIAGAVTQADAETGAADVLDAARVWTLAIILTAAYLISRGLAKSGSHEPYTESPGGPGVGDRVAAASTALREGR